MEFYRVGKLIGLTANQRLDLSSSGYNHKGAIISGDGSQQVKIEFFTKGTTSQGITLVANAIDGTVFTNAIIPARLAATTANASGVTLLLFN